ncbi:uncharacterized protein FIBRA_08432 [Fibroporia radiculosa]|uniref:DUF7330 domain-containing protein n=1 Tax=Fibroporia radiculosa TaxID=599839 RepID=J4GWS8_9APHY|nr:uncharacterized protein FIBRA_08432 [Fibroporia radiculosa]CCM06190.1 predicted protein [Fibroporia radiculosa]
MILADSMAHLKNVRELDKEKQANTFSAFGQTHVVDADAPPPYADAKATCASASSSKTPMSEDSAPPKVAQTSASVSALSSGVPQRVNHISLFSKRAPISGTYLVDPLLAVPSAATGVLSRSSLGKIEREHARNLRGSHDWMLGTHKSSSETNAGFRTRDGNVDLDIAVAGSGAGDYGRKAKARVTASSRHGHVRVNLFEIQGGRCVDLNVSTRKGNIVVLLPPDFCGPITFKTRRGRGNINFLPAFSERARIVRATDRETAVIFSGTSPTEDVQSVVQDDSCVIGTRAGRITVGGFPPKSKFSPDQIPDLTGRVYIVTGGNVGIGRETIKALLEHNAKVYMASRSQEKAEAAINELKEQTGKEALFLQLDLSSLASIRRSAEEYLSKERELHVLINNAGIMWCPIEQLSEDGYDLQFGTNVLGHYYFTKLLIPALIAGAESSADHRARIVNVSSSASYQYTLNWDSFTDGAARRKVGTTMLYAQSKFGNVVVAREFAKRYADKGIISTSVNPGNIQTELQRYVPTVMRAIMNTLILYPTRYGALTQLWAATMPEPLDHNGKFLIPWARVGVTRGEAYDDKIGERLWNWLEEQVKDK